MPTLNSVIRHHAVTWARIELGPNGSSSATTDSRLRVANTFNHQIGARREFDASSGQKMATEDERYRKSSQFRLWSYSPKALKELRETTNNLAQQQIIPRLAADALPEFLTTDEEIQLVKFFTVELLRAAEFLDLPTEIRATAAIFLRRFYITNSVMTYPPDDLLKTCIFFGCKAENFYYRLNKLADALPNTTSEQILAGEFLLCQGMRFAFDVRHPFRALEGAILELRNRLPDEEKRIQAAHGQARHILKFSSILTDVYFHFTPSQIMLAALLISDPGLANKLIPTTGIDSAIREKIISTIEQCKTMLQQEPPENMNQYSTAVSIHPLRLELPTTMLTVDAV